MRHLMLLLVLAPLFGFAQQGALIIQTPSISFDSATNFVVENTLRQNPHDTTEGGYLNAFNRWARFSKRRLALNAPANTNMLKPAGEALFAYMNNINQYCSNDPNNYTGNWSCLGPFNDYYGAGVQERQGRIDAIWVDPNDISYILAGANMGGLWKSTDTGHTWQNITDPSPTNNSVIPGTMGAMRIAVNPLNNDTIYIALNMMNTLRKSNGYAMGLMYSTDGGQTWNYDSKFLNANQQSSIDYFEKYVSKIAYLPGTGHLFAISNNKLLQKRAGNVYWWDVTPPDLPDSIIFTDFEFSKNTFGKIIVSTNAYYNKSHLYVSDITGVNPTWLDLQLTMPAPFYQTHNEGEAATSDGVTDMSISGGDTAYLNIAARLNDSTPRQILVRTPISTVNIELINTDLKGRWLKYDIFGEPGFPPVPDSSDGPIEFIEVSPHNSNVIYGTVHDGENALFRSMDGGQTFDSIQGKSHEDGRCLFIYHGDTSAGGIQDIVFAGTDGGVVMKRAGKSIFESITGTGLAITQFYGLANVDDDEDIMTGGAQDIGGFAYNKRRTEPWVASILNGDAYMTKFANNGSLTSYIEGVPNSLGGPILRVTFDKNTDTFDLEAGAGVVDFGNVKCMLCKQNNLQRPLYFEPDSNKAYIGYLDVWEKPLLTGSWTPAFKSFPAPVGKTRSFAISEPNKDSAYIAYEDAAAGDPTTNDDYAKLFFSYNADDTTLVTWHNRTPPHVEYGGITSMVTHPQTMSRVWIALGNVDYRGYISPDSITHKVLYSWNYGNDWVDISKGLPPLPVNKILYLEGSDDLLFAGTDAGVFKYNKDDSTWYCFNTGLPPVVVNDMEFNYCSGKLRIATFGRGAWEGPAYDNSYRIAPTEIITTNTTWSNDRYVKTGIKVTNGATLTINNSGGDQTNIFMPRNGRIVIDAGAKLIVNGARITNGCEDCMWDGIRLVGNKSQSQHSSNQGNVELNLGTVVEHAKIAVANYGPENYNYSNTGGNIRAIGAIFKNNACAIVLQPYATHSAAVLKRYNAMISDCTFEVEDGEYRGGVYNPFITHIYASGVEGLQIFSNSFYNKKTPPYNIWGKGNGIWALNAGLNTRDNSYSGFLNGVLIEYSGIHPQFSCVIDQSRFDSCVIGIRAVRQDMLTVIRDTFNIGKGETTDIDLNDCLNTIGVWTQGSYNAIIEGNEFIGDWPLTGTGAGGGNAKMTIGCLTDEGAEYERVIYRNYFNNLDRACQARGRNRDQYIRAAFHSKGLRYWCNSFDYNTDDILVTELSTHTSNVVQGIGYAQGTSTKSSGNVFLDRSSIKHITNQSTTHGHIFYSHTGGNTEPLTNSNGVYVLPTLLPWYAHPCAPSNGFPSGGGIFTYPISSSDLNDLKSSFFVSKNDHATLKSSYLSFIDNGDTDGLLDYINVSTQADSPTVLTTLLGYSPYLSYDVLTALGMSDILPHASLMQVLTANPDVLREEDLLEHLEYNIPNPLSSLQIDDLRSASENTTTRSDMESELSEYSIKIALAGNHILNHYYVDTNMSSRDTIPVWLDNINTVESHYMKAGHYVGLGDLSTAETIIDNIPTNFSLTTDEQDKHDLYEEYWGIIAGVIDDGRSMLEMTEAELDDLAVIADNPIASGKEIDWEIEVITTSPAFYPMLPCSQRLVESSFKPGKSTNQSNEAQSGGLQAFTQRQRKQQGIKSKNNLVQVYPNPAKDFVIFTYNRHITTGDISIRVSNAAGQVVDEVPVIKGLSTVRWNTRALPSAVYIYELLSDGKPIDVGRVVISK